LATWAGALVGSVVALEQAHDKADHEVSLPRLALSDEQRQSDHRVVGETLRAVGACKELVPGEVLQEQQRPDALVAVGERVILDDEIQQIRGAQLSDGQSGRPSNVCSMAPSIADSRPPYS